MSFDRSTEATFHPNLHSSMTGIPGHPHHPHHPHTYPHPLNHPQSHHPHQNELHGNTTTNTNTTTTNLFQTNLGLSWPTTLNPTTMDLHSLQSPTTPDGSNHSMSSLSSTVCSSPPLSTTPNPLSLKQPTLNNHHHHHHNNNNNNNNSITTMDTMNTTNTNTNITTNNNNNNNNNNKSILKKSSSSDNDNNSSIDLSKPYHSEWGVMKDQDFHPLTLKHQRDLENVYNNGNAISDFYFWQANLGGYCMADMIQNIVVSSDGAFPLIRRIVEGAPHPGRRKKKRTQA